MSLESVEQQLAALLSHTAMPKALVDPDAVLLAPESVTEEYIANLAVTNAKIASLAADKIVAGTGIINDLTIKATLTIGAGGEIAKADGSSWNEDVLRLASSGVIGDSLVWASNGADIAYVSGQESSGVVQLAMGLIASLDVALPATLLFEDGKVTLGFEGLGYSLTTGKVVVEERGWALLGGLTYAGSYGSGVGVGFISEAAAVPSGNPSSGIIIYVEGGSLKARTTAGNVRTIAAV